jgi:hypothetical protein
MTQSLSQIVKRIKESESKVITPRLDKWLLDHPEGVVTRTEEQRKLLLRLTGDESNSQRMSRFGASSRGTCARQQVFRFIGAPGLRTVDSVLQNIFNDGTWRHIRHQMMGMQAGYLTDVEVKHTMPSYNLTTSLDGENKDEGWMMELKGMRHYGKVVMGEIPEGHYLQMHTMLLVTGYERVIYLVEDKGSNDWVEVSIARDKAAIGKVKDELNIINDAVEDQKLPPMKSNCKMKKGSEYQGCPFKHYCPQVDAWPDGSEI